jgi:double-stranded uracil-DNA glycosylase
MNVNVLPDVIKPDLEILFIGFNPSLRSAELGHHFSGPSNRFWRLLAESGLTAHRFRPEEDHTLLELGYGITNIVPRPTRTALEITKLEYEQGRKELRQKLVYYQPTIACYVGVGVYRAFARLSSVPCGAQASSVVSGVSDFVVSSSSGLNRIPLEQQLAGFVALKNLTHLFRQ